MFTVTYAVFDDLFKFNTALLAPGNVNGRYHHLIERICFCIDDFDGPKRVTLGAEPSYDRCDDVPESPRVSQSLVESDKVRGDFLDAIRGRQDLQELKSRQRLLKLREVQPLPVVYECSRVPPSDIVISCRVGDKKSTAQSQPKTWGKSRTPNRCRPSISREQERPSSMPQDIPSDQSGDAFAPPAALDAGLRLVSSEILGRRSSAISAVQTGEEKLREAKHFAHTHLREMASKRAAQHTWRSNAHAKLERKRWTRISEKRKARDLRFMALLLNFQERSNLEQKQRLYRIGQAKLKTINTWKHKVAEKFLRKINASKLQTVRDRNVEIKLEVRQRRLKEAMWLRQMTGVDSEIERLAVNEPKINSNASVIESVKTYKTGSSSNMSKNLKLQDQLLREKQEFTARMEREERLKEKLANKPVVYVHVTPDQVEVQRYQAWKASELERRNRILTAKLGAMEQRAIEAANERENKHRAYMKHMELEDKRQKRWAVAEAQRDKDTVERAVSHVSGVHQLVPCMHW